MRSVPSGLWWSQTLRRRGVPLATRPYVSSSAPGPNPLGRSYRRTDQPLRVIVSSVCPMLTCSVLLPTVSRCLPPAFAPFVELGTLLAKSRVIAVAGIEPSVVRQLFEDPRLNVIDQRREILGGSGFPNSAGEQSIALTVKKPRVSSARLPTGLQWVGTGAAHRS